MFDYAIFKDAHCSREEKLSCLKTIEQILSLYKRIGEFGLLVLEEEIEKNKDTMLGKGFLLILDGAMPEVVKKIMTNYVYSSNCKGKSLLEKIIIAEGVVFLSSYSENSNLLSEALISHLGEDTIKEAENYLYEAELITKNQQTIVDEYISSILENQEIHANIEDSPIINALAESAYVCRAIFRKVGINCFVNAISCISIKNQIKMIHAFSTNIAYDIVMQLSKLDNTDYLDGICLDSKQKIEDEVVFFEKVGYITL